MKAKQLLPLFCVLVVFICSCTICSCTIEAPDAFPYDPDNYLAQEIQPRMFWAYNYRDSQYYVVKADHFVEGRYCRIWVEQGASVGTATAKNVANNFDSIIYPRMMATFGIQEKMYVDGILVAENTMELADWMGDRDGKLTILLLDIQDNYVPNSNHSRMTGYFSSKDLLSSQAHSNGADMLYIDTNPDLPGSMESNKTIAHEMQHLMNFVTSFLLRSDGDGNIHEMDTWINEGLSAIAEWVYSGLYSENRWTHYNADPTGLIQKGNNFFIWDNHTREHRDARYDDYATVYLFFHWLRLQTGNNTIFKNIISSTESNYRAVTEAANEAMKGRGYNDWGTLLKTWLAANYINASSGPYGYASDSTLGKVKAKTVPAGTKSVRLYPGEGVYSLANAGSLWPVERKNIRYAGLAVESPQLSDTETFANGALLVYNTNTNQNGDWEEGITSGMD